MIYTKISDGGGSRAKAKVTSIGQLVTSPIAYDDTKYVELAADNTGYNFYGPKAGKQFVITGIFMKADKEVGAGVTDISIYEADTDSSTTVDKTLFRIVLQQDDILVASPLNILVNEGKFINGKCDDDDVHVNITGYYIDKIS